ncbi:MAG: pilus assembly protein PilM [bacterium]|nr:pilus assembly protein PilM [bacterium]
MEKLLEKLRGFLPAFLFSKLSMPGGGSFVGIDIGGAFIKVVELAKKDDKVILKTYGEAALGPLSGLEVGQTALLPAEKLAEAMIGLFREANVISRDVIFSIPLTSTLLTVIEMPDVGDEKLKEMIPLEARKYVPTPLAEVSLSHWVIPRSAPVYIDPDSETKNKEAPPSVEVLLAIVHNDVIAKYNTIAEQIGATSVSYEIEVFSTIRATLGRDSAPTMIMDIGAGNTKVALVEEGVVRSSHLINAGSQDVTAALSHAKGISMLKAEEIKREFGLPGDPNDPSTAEITRLAADRIFAEADRIFARYQREKRIAIGKVILSGGGSLMKGVFELAQSSFGTTVVYGNAFAEIEAPAVLLPLLKEAGPEFAVAVGLALRKF